MRDPHVASLIYSLVPESMTSFSVEATPVEAETEGFAVVLADGTLTVTMRDHRSSQPAARGTSGGP